MCTGLALCESLCLAVCLSVWVHERVCPFFSFLSFCFFPFVCLVMTFEEWMGWDGWTMCLCIVTDEYWYYM